MKPLLCLMLLVACAKPKDPVPPEPATDPIVAQFDEAENRLSSQFLEDGWVCSRDPARPGYCVHAGDSLLWTGLWLGAASCDAGFPSELALQGMIRQQGGALVRYDPKRPEFQEYKGGREVTFDGAIGLYVGIAERIRRCPETRQGWAEVVTLHNDYVRENSGRLNVATTAAIPNGFDFLLDLLVADLSGSGLPGNSGDRLDRLVVQASAWAGLVNAQHAAAYRVNLGFVSIQATEALGLTVADAYRWGPVGFCAATRGIDIPTVDQWCARSDLKDWIAAYVPNLYEYRFQRSGSWETPDGNGYETPGLDLIRAMRQAYSF